MVIKRTVLANLINHTSKPEISLLVGPRQAGKTTVIKAWQEILEKRGEKTLFLSLDNDEDKPFFASQSSLIKRVEIEMGKNKGYLLIDEIQRKENAGLFLKGIYDMNLPYKLIVSGSGSLELKEKIHESLAGRKRIFEVTTLSFEEFANFKTDYKYENKVSGFLSINKVKAKQLLLEYLNFGGYPRVVLDETISEKQETIKEILQSYIEKDISLLLGVKKTDDLTNLIKLLSSQIGQLTNFSEIASSLNINIKTLKEYVYYLEKTFIIKRVTPYFRNLRKEITKSPVFYFGDLGMRNYARGFFGKVESDPQIGLLFQNFVYNLLNRGFGEAYTQIHYWRTKDGAEVDFVVEKGVETIPIEVKYKDLKDAKITRPLRSFIEKYKPQKAFVINLSFEDTIKLGSTQVFFLPYYELDVPW